MQSQTLNKTFEELTLAPGHPADGAPFKPGKIERRVSVDTHNMERSDTDSQTDELLGKREGPGERRPAFDVYCASLGQTKQGEYIRKLEGREIYLFGCHMGHRFMLTKKQVLSSGWCNICAKALESIRRHAASNNGELITTSYCRSIRLRCSAGHEFELSHKKAGSRWCKDCSKHSKRKLKDLLERENKRIEDEKCRAQVN